MNLPITYKVDISKPLLPTPLQPMLISGDAEANVIRLELYDGETPYSPGGSCVGMAVRQDGGTVPITGTVDGNTMSAVLPAAAYAIPGAMNLIIKNVNGDVKTSLFFGCGNVLIGETGTAIDPGTIIPSVTDLIQRIDEAVDSIPADYTALLASIAPDYANLSFPVSAGTYAWYNGTLYSAAADIPASETWTPSHWKAAVMGDELTDLKSAIWQAMGGIADYNLFGSAGFVHGYYINAQGVETAGAGFAHTGIISVAPSQIYHFTGTAINRGSGWTMRFHAYKDGVWARQLVAVSVPGTGGAIEQDMTLVSGENGVVISFIDGAVESPVFVGPDGETAIDRVARAMFADYFKCTSAVVLPSGDLNDYYNVSGSWLIDSNHQYTNTPDGLNAGFLLCYAARNFTLQIFYPFTQNYIYKRRGNANGWNAWGKIIADTSDVLQSTGDTTNRTADILSRLTADKVCRLGDGVFYVQSLNMPDDSAIIGSGAGTKIILLETDATEGYAVKLGSRCSIAHVSILGNAEDHTAQGDRYDRTAAYVERHGILWQGTVTASTAGDTTRRANVTDCYIANFSGGGITLQKTGLNTITGINVSDVYIWHCYAGINVAYYSEFNRFANVSVGFCHYGAINNGGNNAFVNCNFSANIEGMLIDNTNGKSPNNSHGSVANCIFDHSDQNYGIGIHLIGVSYGEVFSNCQLFYSEIVAENCNGIVFTSLNAGNHENITVKNSKCVIFSGCMFRGIPNFITTGNQKMIVRDCLAYGETPPADVALSNVNVTAMPVDFTGAIGQTATFSVTAENVASYQWQWRYADHSRDWTDTTAAGNKTASISVEITAARLTYEYRCVMRDASGNAAYTDTVRIIQS